MTELTNKRRHNNGGENVNHQAIIVMKAINELPRVQIAIDRVKDFFNPETIGVFDNIQAYIENYALNITDKAKTEIKSVTIDDYLILGCEYDALGLTIITGDGGDINLRMTLPDME